jgi:hypothetical protein
MTTFAVLYAFVAGVWLGLMPYMLLRYRNCDLFGRGSYKARA